MATIFVIFGASGDLAERKLLPALFDLFRKDLLPEDFFVYGVSRHEYTDKSFRKFTHEAIKRKQSSRTSKGIADFLNRFFYISGNFEDPETYMRVAEALIAQDKQLGVCSNKAFYLAVPPSRYEIIFENLAYSGLSIPCVGPREKVGLSAEVLAKAGWTRILVEKPFGRDLETAQKLDAKLGLLFKEHQIFRIDHYLAKETVQNILTFRFSNVLFQPVWNKNFIERVEITLWEAGGIGHRASFYEDVGALRDVGQNHILQLLALTAMDDPGIIEADAIRKERLKILQALHCMEPKEVLLRTVRGQYESYTKEHHSLSASQTETFFRLTAFLKTERWEGVPFILESGKKMEETKTEVKIFFKPAKHSNILTLRIQPDEGISVVFWAKKPGFSQELEPRRLSFLYKDTIEALELPDAYERVLYDCIRGDQTLFTSTNEVAASWKFITPILEHWDTTRLYLYKEGSIGVATN
jgi:glucose-6-phosphate 1-dehydrogenase